MNPSKRHSVPCLSGKTRRIHSPSNNVCHDEDDESRDDVGSDLPMQPGPHEMLRSTTGLYPKGRRFLSQSLIGSQSTR